MLESCRGHKGRVKNRAKAMIYHLPFLHSLTHSHSFHPCDSVILVFVFFRFRSVFRSLSWNAQNLIDHYVIIMLSLYRRFCQNWSDLRILFPIKPLILNESTHTKKTSMLVLVFLYSFFSKINRLRSEQKYINMAVAHKNLTVS